MKGEAEGRATRMLRREARDSTRVFFIRVKALKLSGAYREER